MADIGTHVANLKAAMGNNDKFDRTVAGLCGDRSITKNHMQDIAHKFMGWRPGNANSREGHIDYIKRHQLGEAAGKARAAALDKPLGKWGR